MIAFLAESLCRISCGVASHHFGKRGIGIEVFHASYAHRAPYVSCLYPALLFAIYDYRFGVAKA